MTLQAAIEQYVAWRQARGSKFASGTSILRQYARSVDDDIECDAVRPEQARAFLTGAGPLTRTRSVKRSALNGFYRYALGRGLATRSPLPADEPPEPESAPPYIYSPDDLHSLFAAVEPCRRRAVQLDAPTFRALLLLLYGAGLRVGEALGLAQEDVEVLPDPTRSGRTGPRASTGIVRHNPSGVPPSCRGRSDLSRQLRRDSAQDENRPQGLRRLAPPRRRAQRGGSSLPTAFA